MITAEMGPGILVQPAEAIGQASGVAVVTEAIAAAEARAAAVQKVAEDLRNLGLSGKGKSDEAFSSSI